MGGCASKPKDFDTKRQATPVEEPAKAEETITAPAYAGKVAESQDEVAPLVDLSKPEEEEKKGEEKEVAAAVTKEAEATVLMLLGEVEVVVENPKGETVEVEVAAKEGEVIYVEAVKETKEEEKKDVGQPKPTTNSEEKKEEELLVKV